MLKKEFMDYLDSLDYETQKEKLRLLKEDTQQYDDSCNIVEIFIESLGNCIISIINLFK